MVGVVGAVCGAVDGDGVAEAGDEWDDVGVAVVAVGAGVAVDGVVVCLVDGGGVVAADSVGVAAVGCVVVLIGLWCGCW